MSLFNALNESLQSTIQTKTNSAVTNLVTRKLPLEREKLLGLGDDVFVASSVNELLGAVGINQDRASSGTAVQQQLVSNAAANATTLVRAVQNSDLTERNISDFMGYYKNSSISDDGTVSGDISAAINGLSDAQGALLTCDAPTTLFNNPTLYKQYVTAKQDVSASTDTSSTSYSQNQSSRSGSNGNANTAATTVASKISTLTSPYSYSDPLITYAPKFQYTYIVEFQMHPEYQNEIPSSFTFLVTKFTKPKIPVEYEEVNFYNFRTQVPKSTKFGNISLTLHDDIKSESMMFLVSYLRHISPIMSKDNHGAGVNSNYENNGLDFNDSTASYSLLTKDGNTNIIKEITVYHYFNANRTMDVHHFYNPKITEVDLGGFDMSSPDGSTLSMEITYDSYVPEVGVAPQTRTNVYAIAELAASTPEDTALNGEADKKKFSDTETDITDLAQSTTFTDPKTHYQPIPTKLAAQINEGFTTPGLLSSDTLSLISVPDTRAKVVNNLNISTNTPVERNEAIAPGNTVTFDQIIADARDKNPAKLTYKEVTDLKTGLSDLAIDTASQFNGDMVFGIVGTTAGKSAGFRVIDTYFPKTPQNVQVKSTFNNYMQYSAADSSKLPTQEEAKAKLAAAGTTPVTSTNQAQQGYGSF